MPTNANASDKLWDMIKDIRVAMMTTEEQDGTLRSRPMYMQQAEFDGDIWFFTRRDSPKVDEIMHDKQVNLSYAAPGDNRYVSVSGKGELVDDMGKKEELWNDMLKAWFPNGLDDPQLVLLKVNADSAQYWDSTSSKLVQLAGFVKASVTGEAFEPDGVNEKVKL